MTIFIRLIKFSSFWILKAFILHTYTYLFTQQTIPEPPLNLLNAPNNNSRKDERNDKSPRRANSAKSPRNSAPTSSRKSPRHESMKVKRNTTKKPRYKMCFFMFTNNSFCRQWESPCGTPPNEQWLAIFTNEGLGNRTSLVNLRQQNYIIQIQ